MPPPACSRRFVSLTCSFARSNARYFLASFNDVYRVNQRYVPEDGVENLESGPRYISAAQFACTLDDVRDGWADTPNEAGGKEGLVLFSGGRQMLSLELCIPRLTRAFPIRRLLAERRIDVSSFAPGSRARPPPLTPPLPLVRPGSLEGRTWSRS